MINIGKIINSQALTSVFGCVPDFIGSELMDIRIRSFQRTIVIHLMTTQTVKNTPKRWGKFDVVYVEISLFDIRNLLVNGDISSNSIIQFDLKDLQNDGLLEIKCDNRMQVKCSFDWARVEEIIPGLIGQP